MSNATNLAFFACSSFENVCKAYKSARSELGEILSAVEFLDKSCVDIVLEELTHLRHPLDDDTESPFYLLIETSGSNDQHDKEKLDSFLEKVMGDELVIRTCMAFTTPRCSCSDVSKLNTERSPCRAKSGK